MKKSQIVPIQLKLRVAMETLLHLRSVHDRELERARGGAVLVMTTYHPDCETGMGCGSKDQQ